jgi:hypothetical protein
LNLSPVQKNEITIVAIGVKFLETPWKTNERYLAIDNSIILIIAAAKHLYTKFTYYYFGTPSQTAYLRSLLTSTMQIKVPATLLKSNSYSGTISGCLTYTIEARRIQSASKSP